MRALAANLLRLMAIGTAVGIIGVMVIYGGWRFGYPYAQEWQARVEVRRLEARVDKLRRQNHRLRQQAKRLATAEGVKDEAHRLGLLKPGERSLRFMAQPREAPPNAAPPRDRASAVKPGSSPRAGPKAEPPPDD